MKPSWCRFYANNSSKYEVHALVQTDARHIREDFAKKIDVFKKYPFHSSLHTHKLSSNLADYYSFYLRDGFRVLFDFVGPDIVLLANIGSHDDYRKWSRG